MNRAYYLKHKERLKEARRQRYRDRSQDQIASENKLTAKRSRNYRQRKFENSFWSELKIRENYEKEIRRLTSDQLTIIGGRSQFLFPSFVFVYKGRKRYERLPYEIPAIPAEA
jgi:hypothetical protein